MRAEVWLLWGRKWKLRAGHVVNKVGHEAWAGRVRIRWRYRMKEFSFKDGRLRFERRKRLEMQKERIIIGGKSWRKQKGLNEDNNPHEEMVWDNLWWRRKVQWVVVEIMPEAGTVTAFSSGGRHEALCGPDMALEFRDWQPQEAVLFYFLAFYWGIVLLF